MERSVVTFKGIRIEGLDQLKKFFVESSALLRMEQKRTMTEVMTGIHERVPDYPPAPPNSSYRRTGQLGRSISTKVQALNDIVVGEIGTNLDYAPHVISSEATPNGGPQAWMHKDRWWTLQGVVDGAMDWATERFQEMVDRLLAKARGG
jgi:hypothetical protein